MRRKNEGIVGVLLTASLLLTGCTAGTSQSASDPVSAAPAQTTEAVQEQISIVPEEISQEPQLSEMAQSLVDSGVFTELEVSGFYDESEAQPLTQEDPQITAPGTYILSGSLTDTTLTVDVGEDEDVCIILDNAAIENKDGPAIYVAQAGNVILLAKDGTENTISDGQNYTYEPDEKADSAIFSRGNLILNGTGSLTITGNNKHAVESKDDLVVAMDTLTISAEGSGLKGKDCVKIAWGKIDITSGGDAIKSDNDEDEEKGYIYIADCDLTVVSEKDGLQAETLLTLVDGTYNITCGGGAQAELLDEEESYKGIKSGKDIVISGGDITVNTLDDAIHADNNIAISGGTFLLASGDDGIHADMDLSISGGDIVITESYEGLEGAYVNISGGNIDLVASDDGINASGDLVEEGQGPMFGGTGEELNISGGYVLVNANGDGLDSNGTLTVSGGVLLVTGPVSSMDGALDSDGEMKVTGGVVIAAGSSGMPQSFSVAENQGSIMTRFDTQAAGTSIAICDAEGNVVAAFTPPKEYGSVVISAPGIQSGNTYTIVTGGDVADADKNGFAENTTISGGETLETIELTESTYSNGGFGGFGGGFPGFPGGGPGGMGGGPGQDNGGFQMPDMGDFNPGDFDGNMPDNFPGDFDGNFPEQPPTPGA